MDKAQINIKEKSVYRNGIIKEIKTKLEWPKNVTAIDLSDKNIVNFDENVNLPPNLYELNLSRNKLVEIPNTVLKSRHLKILDVSFNFIENFDDKPNFCHTIEHLNLNNNNLIAPPHWIWSESPNKLRKLNLSYNANITNSLKNYKDLLHNSNLVTEIKMYNCNIGVQKNILNVFSHAKVLEYGNADYSCFTNHLEEVPCQGLDKCCDIERLNLSNTHIYHINPNIDTYKKLIEINLSQNNIGFLPNEFCNLENLEICILSCNNLIYLPDDMVKLKKLTCLHLDENNLCMLPDALCDLLNLRILDLYNNNLHEVSDKIINISELDLAQNYFEEPDDAQYVEKRHKLRLNVDNRINGRKIEVIKTESEHSPVTSDEEYELFSNNDDDEELQRDERKSSSPEDWDCDDYWVPHYECYTAPQPQSSWLYFVKQKMEEGNFCPMDAHPVSVSERVKYEKMYNPRIEYESDGQFDDYSDDNS